MDELDIDPCSNDCIFGRIKGMSTNGGCQHLKLELVETRRLLRKAGHKIQRFQARVAELEQELKLCDSEYMEEILAEVSKKMSEKRRTTMQVTFVTKDKSDEG